MAWSDAWASELQRQSSSRDQRQTPIPLLSRRPARHSQAAPARAPPEPPLSSCGQSARIVATAAFCRPSPVVEPALRDSRGQVAWRFGASFLGHEGRSSCLDDYGFPLAVPSLEVWIEVWTGLSRSEGILLRRHSTDQVIRFHSTHRTDPSPFSAGSEPMLIFSGCRRLPCGCAFHIFQ